MNFVALSVPVSQAKGRAGSRKERQRLTVQLKAATADKQSHTNDSEQQQKAKAISPGWKTSLSLFQLVAFQQSSIVSAAPGTLQTQIFPEER